MPEMSLRGAALPSSGQAFAPNRNYCSAQSPCYEEIASLAENARSQ